MQRKKIGYKKSRQKEWNITTPQGKSPKRACIYRAETNGKEKCCIKRKRNTKYPQNTKKIICENRKTKLKKYFTKKETSFLLSLCTEKADVSDISMKTFETLEKKIPDKAEKALLSGKSEDFDVYQKIFEVLKKSKRRSLSRKLY